MDRLTECAMKLATSVHLSPSLQLPPADSRCVMRSVRYSCCDVLAGDHSTEALTRSSSSHSRHPAPGHERMTTKTASMNSCGLHPGMSMQRSGPTNHGNGSMHVLQGNRLKIALSYRLVRASTYKHLKCESSPVSSHAAVGDLRHQ